MRKLHLFWAMLVLTLFTLLVGILCYQAGYKRGKFDHLLRILD